MKHLWVLLVVAICGAGCAPRPQMPPADQTKLAREIARQQKLIMVRLSPEVADQTFAPTDLSLTTDAEINLIGWAPRFMLSLATPQGASSTIAVLSEFQLEKASNGDFADPRQIPIQSRWASAEKCPALKSLLVSFERTANHRFELRALHREPPPSGIHDGAGITAEARGMFSGSSSYAALTIAGRVGTPIANWTTLAFRRLEPCLRPLS